MMKKLVVTLVIIAAVIIVFFIVGPFFVIEEGEQAVRIRFGEIIRVYTEAGLKTKVPFVDNVVTFPKKILAWDGEAQIIPTKQPENQFIWVDTTARWKITDLKLFYESVGNLNQAQSRLDDIIDSSVRSTISQNFLIEAIRNTNDIYALLLETVRQRDVLGGDLTVDVESLKVAKGRIELSRDIFTKARSAMVDQAGNNQFGIELIDIVIRQIKYSDDLTGSVYQRMIQERNQAAEKIRSEGKGEKDNILGKLAQEVQTILSQAEKEALEIKGTSDAEAAQIYANAYNQNTGFFKLWRSLESYKELLPYFKKTLSTDASYFDYLYNEKGE
jgi:membrane protease subunit HflC